jgi:hypothetical protein
MQLEVANGHKWTCVNNGGKTLKKMPANYHKDVIIMFVALPKRVSGHPIKD